MDELFAMSGEVEARTPAAEFVLRFQRFYERMAHEPFKYRRADFVLAAKLINAYGMIQVVTKARTLARMCAAGTTWFTEDGWASFSIGTMSRHWNRILPESVKPTKEEENDLLKKRVREQNERVNRRLAAGR